MKKIYNFYKKMLLFVAAILLFCISLRAQNPQHVRFDATITPAPCEGGSFTDDASKHVTITVNLPGGGTRTLTYLTYNQGANPALTPRQQMAYSGCETDMTVFGGWYQFGRNNINHAFRCDPTPDVDSDSRFTKTKAPSPTPDVYPQFIYGMSNPFRWSGSTGYTTLWGSGAMNPPTSSGSNNPCPSGYRVPTEHEWALLSWEGGDPTTETDDEINDFSGTAALAPSGLWWVKVNNGLVNTSFTEGNMCGYAIYQGSTWETTPVVGTNLIDALAPEPLLFLPANGLRMIINGQSYEVGKWGWYGSSTQGGNMAFLLYFEDSHIKNIPGNMSEGRAVRCIAEEECAIPQATINSYTPSTREATVTCQTPATLTITVAGNPADYTYQWYDETGYAIPYEISATYVTFATGNFYCVVTPKCVVNTGTPAPSLPFKVTLSSEFERPPLPVFMEYNLGADPELNTPAKQMAYMADNANGTVTQTSHGRVFGGRYQWGRGRSQVDYAIDPPSDPDPSTYLLYNGNSDHAIDLAAIASPSYDFDGQIIGQDNNHVYSNLNDWRGSGTATAPDVPGQWDALWGNGEAIGTPTSGLGAVPYMGNYYQRPVKTCNDPCPSGWRVPTQNDWELMCNYDCDPRSASMSGQVLVPSGIGIGNATSGLTWVAIRCSDSKCTINTNWSVLDPVGYGYAIYNTTAWNAAGYNNTTDLISASTQPLLFLPAAGYRNPNNGSVEHVSVDGAYWSSSVNSTWSYSMGFANTLVFPLNTGYRATGMSIRCVKCSVDEPCTYK